VSSLGCAVFREEVAATAAVTGELQSGIEVGAECVETRRQGTGATGTSRSSLSSECCMLLSPHTTTITTPLRTSFI
jgi:hypothetical protein